MILNNEFFLCISLSENTMDCPLSHPYSISNGMKCCRTKECPSPCTNMLKGYQCKDSIVCPHPPCNDHNLGELHMFVAIKIFQTEMNFFKPFLNLLRFGYDLKSGGSLFQSIAPLCVKLFLCNSILIPGRVQTFQCILN